MAFRLLSFNIINDATELKVESFKEVMCTQSGAILKKKREMFVSGCLTIHEQDSKIRESGYLIIIKQFWI